MKDQTATEKNINAQTNKPSNKIVDSSCLQSQLLISMPSLADPYFAQSVTLICQHNKNGCFGLTINKPIEITVADVLEQLGNNSGQPVTNRTKNNQTNKSLQSIPVLRGGPVQIEQGFVIHDGDTKWENTLSIIADLSVTTSQDILVDIAKNNGPENYLLTLGCASWVGGQIESEIMNNSWLNCPIDKKILFNMPFAHRWLGAADTLGVNLNTMSGASGHD